MTETSNPFAWIELAEEDYAVTRSALRHKSPLINSACFHAQQCAEKYLKAILISRNIAFPKTHDLLMLVSICEEASIFIPIDKKKLNSLNDYSVRVRYPGDNPTLEEAKEALQIAQSVRRFVRKFFNLR